MRVLTGLDGSNPLGFLAGLGVLDVLSAGGQGSGTPPRLAWRTGDWRAVIAPSGDLDDRSLIGALRADLETWRDEPALDLRYRKKAEKADEEWDLKPPGRGYREYLSRLVADMRPGRRRSIDFAAAFATEVARDNNGNTKPTALHFTAGQQEFLRMVGELVEKVTDADLEEALFGPWRYKRTLPVLGWDCTATRAYALRATDPSKDKRTGVPGADWLAFRGLSFLRVAPKGGQILTTGCSGGWKTGKFTWPLWEIALDRDTVQALLLHVSKTASVGGTESDEAIRRARGISAVFSCAIRRSDQGGYGSFSPSSVG